MLEMVHQLTHQTPVQQNTQHRVTEQNIAELSMAEIRGMQEMTISSASYKMHVSVIESHATVRISTPPIVAPTCMHTYIHMSSYQI